MTDKPKRTNKLNRDVFAGLCEAGEGCVRACPYAFVPPVDHCPTCHVCNNKLDAEGDFDAMECSSCLAELGDPGPPYDAATATGMYDRW